MKLNNYNREAAEGMLYMIVSSFEGDLEEIMILHDERLDYGGWFFNCRLFYNDGIKMDIPFVYYDGNEWLFTPCDWQSGNLPTEAKNIDNIDWRVDDTETEGIIFEGQPMLAPWAAEITEQREERQQRRKSLGNQLRDAREEIGLSLLQVEEETGISEKTIARIEAGRTNATIDTIGTLATAYNTKVIISK
ncbi:MAG: helix-turn-helix domain-containing protein [Muribaculaceae bacterium]|nr:helix-turn-helix domain-containing protein [Muribaculaceae bacterium]